MATLSLNLTLEAHATIVAALAYTKKDLDKSRELMAFMLSQPLHLRMAEMTDEELQAGITTIDLSLKELSDALIEVEIKTLPTTTIPEAKFR